MEDKTADKLEAELKQFQKVHDSRLRLCAADLFYFLKHVSTVDEDNQSVRKFPVHYEYLHRVNREIETHGKVIILKSRRLLISWLGVMRMLHGAMFSGTGLAGDRAGFRGGIMSVGETEAQYLIERTTKAYQSLPDWLKKINSLVTDNKMIMTFEKGGTIQAFPMKRQGPQTFGFSEVFFDEMALQEAARTTWVGMIPTLGGSGKVIAVSTPNGKNNFFYKVWQNEGNMYPGLHRVTIHWSENPEHDAVWIKGQKDAIGNNQDYARMFELSFAHSTGDRVFPDFDSHHVLEFSRILKQRPILFGWDFGFHYPACLIGQCNSRDQYIVHREIIDYNVGFDIFCNQVKAVASSIYERSENDELHFIDPAGFQAYHQKANSGAVSDAHEIRLSFQRFEGEQVMIRPGAVGVGTRTNEGPRLKQVRKTLNIRADDMVGMLVNKQCVNLIEGFNGGYCFPDNGGETPEKNEYSHPHDALQYLVTGFNRMYGYVKEKPKEKSQRRTRIGHGTGM